VVGIQHSRDRWLFGRHANACSRVAQSAFRSEIVPIAFELRWVTSIGLGWCQQSVSLTCSKRVSQREDFRNFLMNQECAEMARLAVDLI
jgi:hypothetical protein